MKKLFRFFAVAVFGMATAGAAQAQNTATGSFLVSANVQAACTVAATNLAFGNYLANSGAPLDATSTITVTCSNGTGYGVVLDGTPAARTMTRSGGGGTLNYGMFSDAGHATAFAVTGATGSGGAQGYTVFGRIPGSQFALAGTYGDTVNITVNY